MLRSLFYKGERVYFLLEMKARTTNEYEYIIWKRHVLYKYIYYIDTMRIRKILLSINFNISVISLDLFGTSPILFFLYLQVSSRSCSFMCVGGYTHIILCPLCIIHNNIVVSILVVGFSYMPLTHLCNTHFLSSLTTQICFYIRLLLYKYMI